MRIANRFFSNVDILWRFLFSVMGQNANQNMGQGNPGMQGQQTPALVAQLQRQMPNQQNMMGQQQHYPQQQF